jgi:hypothetical protein
MGAGIAAGLSNLALHESQLYLHLAILDAPYPSPPDSFWG